MMLVSKIAMLGLVGLAVPAGAQSAAHGMQLFGQCGACHSINGRGGRMGPDLKAVVGRKAGTLPGYSYSPAMKASGIVWNDKTLAAFLASPQTVVHGTKMPYAGMSKPADRGDLVAYLKTLK